MSATPKALNGSRLFDKIGCETCHVRTLTTAPAGTKINGGTFTVLAALGGQDDPPLWGFPASRCGNRRRDGVPQDVPLIISESGITAGRSSRGYLGVTGHAIWECDAFGTFFAGGGTAFYRPAINDGAADRWNYGGGPDGGGAYGTPQYTPFTSAHLINFEWLQHGGGANQIFPASADLIDAAGRTVITSYAVHRPDGTWSLMLINHDLYAAHPIHLVIDDASHAQHSFAGPVALVQYCNIPGENKNTTMTPAPDGMYTLPVGSITVIRGKLR